MDVFFSTHTDGLCRAQADYMRCRSMLNGILQEVERLRRNLVAMEGMESCAARLKETELELEVAFFAFRRLHDALEDVLISYYRSERHIERHHDTGGR